MRMSLVHQIQDTDPLSNILETMVSSWYLRELPLAVVCIVLMD